MKNSYLQANDYAASEVIGAVLLIIIAVVVAALIYFQTLPVPLPPHEPNVDLMGYVDHGTATIRHMGGESLPAYEIYVDGDSYYKHENNGDSWEIGENLPLPGYTLLDEEDQIRIMVYALNDDGSKPLVFSGILSGEDTYIPITPIDPMLISSLRTDTVDEDLICYDNGTFPDSMSTYIYRWMVNGESLAEIVMPFDTENDTITRDYSGNGYNGTIVSATWTDQGKVGGAYYFGGASDYISLDLPGSLDDLSNNDFSVSIWLKSDDITHDHRVALEIAGTDDIALILQFGTEIHFGVYEDGIKRAVRTENLSSNTWYHIAGVWDASEDSLAIYINGTISTEIGYRTYALGAQYGFHIGHGTASSRFWLGFIDEAQIYDRALSAEQIYQMYRCTKEGFYNKSIIVSEETAPSNIWQCIVIPNDGTQDYDAIESNILQITSYGGGE